MIKALIQHHKRVPRRNRRGATMLLALILAFAIAIPVVQVFTQEAARERHLDVMRGYAIELAHGFDQLDQMVYEEAGNAGSPHAAWFDSAGSLRAFTPPADVIASNRLNDVTSFFTYRDRSTDIYVGGAVLDMSALEGDEENAVVDALSVIAEFEDSDYEEAARRYQNVGGAAPIEGQYIVYFHRFNGLNERYMFRQARARETSNALERTALRQDFDLNGHSLRAATIGEDPETPSHYRIGAARRARDLTVVTGQASTGFIAGEGDSQRVIQTGTANDIRIGGNAESNTFTSLAALNAPGLNVTGLDQSSDASTTPLQSQVTGALTIEVGLDATSLDARAINVSEPTPALPLGTPLVRVTDDGTAREITADQIVVTSENQTTNVFIDTSNFNALQTSNCLGC